jgi:hypothetical protein
MRRALFVGNEHVMDWILVLGQRIVQGQDGATGKAKDDVNTLLHKGLPHHLRTCHFHIGFSSTPWLCETAT